MSAIREAAVPALAVEGLKRPPFRRALWRLTRRQPMGAVSAAFLLLIILASLLADFISPYHPFAMVSEYPLEPPSQQHLLGTDLYGRDMLSRIIHGSRVSLSVGLIAVGIASILGSASGLISGYWSGSLVDAAIQRLMDALMSIPMLVLAIAIMAVLGVSIQNVMIAIGITQMPRTARVVMGAVLTVKENQYVEAAVAIGCRSGRILLRHILPNVFAPIIILASIGLGQSIVVEATLSFLGYGTPPPFPSWGGMLSGQGREFFEAAPWVAIFPGLALTLTVLAFNLFGDAVRDILDPRLRGHSH